MADEIRWALDVLGQMPLKQARKARFLVIINDDETATLRSLWLVDGEPVFIDRPLISIARSNGGIDYVFWCESEAFVVTPQDCSCGAGIVAFAPMAPGAVLTRVRMPSWLMES